jgi:hypothetical protein
VIEAGWAHPERAAAVAQRIGRIEVGAEPPTAITPPPDGLSKALKACGGWPSAPVWFHECTDRGCAWVLGGPPAPPGTASISDRENRQRNAWCLFVTDGERQWVRNWEDHGGRRFGADDQRLCFQHSSGGPYGSAGGLECYARRTPAAWGSSIRPGCTSTRASGTRC